MRHRALTDGTQQPAHPIITVREFQGKLRIKALVHQNRYIDAGVTVPPLSSNDRYYSTTVEPDEYAGYPVVDWDIDDNGNITRIEQTEGAA